MADKRYFCAGATAQAHWERLKQLINLPVAACTFVLLALATSIGLQVFSRQAEQFYYDVSREVNYCDMRELNEYGDYLLLQHLAGSPHSGREVVLLGASYTAGSDVPSPGRRLHNLLETELHRLNPGPVPWEVTNLASNGYDAWALFYVTRLLRERRRPDVLIVSPDILHESDRSLHLLLNVGTRPAELAVRELAPVVRPNNQLLYTSEANFKRLLREHVSGFRAFAFLSTSYPKRENIKRWLRFTTAYLQGEEIQLSPPPNRHADGSHKSWQELPEASRIIERRIETGTTIKPLTPDGQSNLELLGAELAAIQAEGTSVVVLTMPRNPVVPLDPQGVDTELARWAKRHGLEFHDYWQSGLIPTGDYKDTGHFMEEGQAIMAHEIAGLILAPVKGGMQ